MQWAKSRSLISSDLQWWNLGLRCAFNNLQFIVINMAMMRMMVMMTMNEERVKAVRRLQQTDIDRCRPTECYSYTTPTLTIDRCKTIWFQLVQTAKLDTQIVLYKKYISNSIWKTVQVETNCVILNAYPLRKHQKKKISANPNRVLLLHNSNAYD